MATIQNISRRDFLKTTGTAGALVIGANFVPGGLVKEAQAQAVAKPWLQGCELAPGRSVSAARIHHHECAHGHRQLSLTRIAREARGGSPVGQAAYWISGGGAIWYRVRTAET